MKPSGFRQLQSRLLFYFAGLFGLTLAIIFLFVEQVFRDNTEAVIQNELIVAERVFSRLLTERSAQLTRWAIALAGDYAFKRVMTAPDHGTLLSALANLGQRVEADAAYLVSTDYRILADINHPDQIDKPPFYSSELIERAEEEGAADTLAVLQGKPYQLVAVPILAPDPVAWLCIGFEIDRDLLAQLKELVKLDISILTIGNQSMELHVSTLLTDRPVSPERDWNAFLGQTSFFETVQDRPFLSRLVLLHQQDGMRLVALIQRSWHDALADFYRLRWLMAWIALAGMAIVLLVSVGLARTVSRPVQILVDGVRAIAAGQYTVRIAVTARDEIAELTHAFNEMNVQLAEKEKIRNLLGKVVSPAVVTELLNSEIQLGGEVREITALFSDLAGFTSIAEAMAPEALVALLNEYLTQMSLQINANEGVIDKYIGDAIVAFWGAPVIEAQHTILALKSALAMQTVLAQCRHRWKSEGLPLLSMRIGINTGLAVVGNMGSTDRMDYTMIGDTVNLAARLEGANKYYGSEILLSEYSYAKVGELFLCREIDRVRVPGKTQPVTLYQLLCEHEHASIQALSLCAGFADALEAFRAQHWDDAERLFGELVRRFNDAPSRLYLQRLQPIRTAPPTTPWECVYNLEK